MNYKEKYNEYKDLFDRHLDKYLKSVKLYPQILDDSFKYSLKVGGKRIRPVIMLASADYCGADREDVLDFALALELIHTYSLIHDDLPEMDNDDYRRGKPSNHKMFGQAYAVLAGDSLLNSAYSILLNKCSKGQEYINAARVLCEYAGVTGMIAGQVADMQFADEKYYTEENLEYIYENKTAKLLSAALIVPCILSHGKYYPEFKQLGSMMGYLFQLTDDILDVEGSFENLGKTTGKDKDDNKLTAVSLYGMEASKFRADIVCDDCTRLLECMEGDTQFLRDLVVEFKTRIG